jgi:hypothetical protein
MTEAASWKKWTPLWTVRPKGLDYSDWLMPDHMVYP